MARLSGSFSIWDERNWGSDSPFRSSLYRVEIGAISYGYLTSSDFEDWYRLTLPGSGTYRVTLSNDAANNYAGNTWFTSAAGVRVQLTDSFGLVYSNIGNASASGLFDGSISFQQTAGANTDFFIKLSNLGFFDGRLCASSPSSRSINSICKRCIAFASDWCRNAPA